ncbi:hypothetical protein L226DRAFT_463839 [Lentinus tigrinus ALCF2SS1-7]|uniref:uncharacterized protein n=1 Tax=Lentinus tigrinus ALCF2SS1-7 TaxID=1328758 RepID=UPI001165FF06|nr:hypothetical protein L226DRAFT_463839 [Lentinus tigrinus ALCF2SS1-7]
MGRFSDLRREEGTGHFIIPDHIWQEIAQETKDAVKQLPAAFVGVIPDLITQRDRFTADTWAFWFMYIAPIVLRGRFQHVKYYKHACDLVSIMRRTLQFEIARTEIKQLRLDIISWVERYEEYYYQYDSERLSACLMVVHGLLHVADDMLFAGPVWGTWTFFMERFCGSLKRALRSRSRPWANLDRRALNIAHANQLLVKYDFEEELLPSHPMIYLRRPCLTQYEPSDPIRRIVAEHLIAQIGGRRSIVQNALPRCIPAWGKFRIGGGGDKIRAMIAENEHMGTPERNSSFVRYSILGRTPDGEHFQVTQYGRLLGVLELSLPLRQQYVWKGLAGSTLLLAIISPCKTNGEDATEELTLYRKLAAEIIIDVNAIEAVVGRVYSRKSWGIVDRSNALARTVFTTEYEGRVEAGEEDDEPDDLPEASDDGEHDNARH